MMNLPPRASFIVIFHTIITAPGWHKSAVIMTMQVQRRTSSKPNVIVTGGKTAMTFDV